MPIVIEHRPAVDLVGALAVLTAEAQERRRQREQAEQEAIRQRAAQAPIRPLALPQPVQQAAPRTVAPSANPMLQSVMQAWGGLGAGGRGRGADPESLAAGLLGKFIDNHGDAEQEMLRGQFGLQRANLAGQFDLQQEKLGNEANALQAEQQANARLAQEFATDQPDWLEGAIGKTHQWSADQKTEWRKSQNIINKARTDPTLTPNEKARAIAIQEQIIAEIRNYPEEIPRDERPRTPQQEASDLTWTEPGPVTGQEIEWQFDYRNERPRKVPTATGQAKIDVWKEQQKLKAQQELELWKKANGINSSASESPTKSYDAAVKSLMAKHAYDREPYQPTVDDIRAEMALRDSFDGAATGQAPPPPDATPPPTSAQTPPSQAPQVFDPAEHGLNPVSSPESIAALITAGYVGVGDVIQTPQGPREITVDVMRKLGLQ